MLFLLSSLIIENMINNDKYITYTLEDFIWDDDFRQWVLAPDYQSITFWEGWLKKYPERKLIINQAREVLLQLRLEETQLSEKQKQRMVSNVLTAIAVPVLNVVASPRQQAYNKKTIGTYIKYVFGIAAALLIGVAAVWMVTKDTNTQDLYTYSSLVKKSANSLSETINVSAVPLVFRLDDGSKVTLEKGAKISYAPAMGSLAKREVYLSGEAFFEVTKNPLKPFVVYSNGLVTKVLGTSFRIKADEGAKDVTVEVHTGKVWISKMKVTTDVKGPEINGVVLVPNQQVVFDKQVENLQVSVVANPQPVNAADREAQAMEFKDETVSKVLFKLSKFYGIDIVYDTTVLNKYPITTSFTDETLFERLNVICTVIGAKYINQNGQIIVTTTPK
ncbi:FecR family protein [Parasediminibacterium sp. JCM 36343]|uniref:FecR family protein n=1 Tax=Parasediminibacterium sp. JCM 36343 TaxID=3374279 RepID=UPI00397DAB3D